MPDNDNKGEAVKARYLGESVVLMRHLETLEGPHRGQLWVSRKSGDTEFVAPGGLKDGDTILAGDAACLVAPGDVIPIDRHSAEEREDFELIEDVPVEAHTRKSKN